MYLLLDNSSCSWASRQSSVIAGDPTLLHHTAKRPTIARPVFGPSPKCPACGFLKGGDLSSHHVCRAICSNATSGPFINEHRFGVEPIVGLDLLSSLMQHEVDHLIIGLGSGAEAMIEVDRHEYIGVSHTGVHEVSPLSLSAGLER